MIATIALWWAKRKAKILVISTVVAALAAFAVIQLKQAEARGAAKYVAKSWQIAYTHQKEQARLSQQEAQRTAKLVADMQAREKARDRQTFKSVAQVDEVVTSDPKAAECGDAAIAESLLDVMREYKARAATDVRASETETRRIDDSASSDP